MNNEVKTIPFVKPVRFGNFKLWKSKLPMTAETSDGQKKVKGKKVSIECINVSNLDGTFCVRIPQSVEMFGMITAAYQWVHSEVEDERNRGESFLRIVFSNILYVSSVCNGFYHQAVEMVTTAYAFPAVLTDKKQSKAFKKDAEDLLKRFLVWREEYDKQMKLNEPSEKEMHSDDIAEQAIDIVEKKE